MLVRLARLRGQGKQAQTDVRLKLTMLGDRGTRNFLYGSLQLYGRVDDTLLQVAREVLAANDLDQAVELAVGLELLFLLQNIRQLTVAHAIAVGR